MWLNEYIYFPAGATPPLRRWSGRPVGGNCFEGQLPLPVHPSISTRPRGMSFPEFPRHARFPAS
jgi:hypothetical protein